MRSVYLATLCAKNLWHLLALPYCRDVTGYRQPEGVIDSFAVYMRDFEAGDANFILRTWLRSYRGRMHSIPDMLYYEHQQTLIRRLAQRSRVAIASVKTQPEFIMGFCVAEPLLEEREDEPLRVHFCFTKLTYRQMGLARRMLCQLGWNPLREIHVSHWTHASRALNESGKFRLINNPFLLMEIPNAHKYTPVTHRESPIQNSSDVPVGEGDGGNSGG